MKTKPVIRIAKANIKITYSSKTKLIAGLQLEESVDINILIAGLHLLKQQLQLIKKEQGNCNIKNVEITNLF